MNCWEKWPTGANWCASSLRAVWLPISTRVWALGNQPPTPSTPVTVWWLKTGAILAETTRFQFDTQLAVVDIDVERLVNERLKNSSFAQAASIHAYREVLFSLPEHLPVEEDPILLRPGLSRTPFVPANADERAEHCREIFAIQATGLAKRLKHTGAPKVVIGVSGGLDSTLALLVAVTACDRLKLERKGVLAITMPGFGTTARTRTNAERLADLLGVSLRVIPITASVRQHFRGHRPRRTDP